YVRMAGRRAVGRTGSESEYGDGQRGQTQVIAATPDICEVLRDSVQVDVPEAWWATVTGVRA
ncbi:MAG: hypothetical protein ACREJT_08450, partial [Myxococcota bacterium]